MHTRATALSTWRTWPEKWLEVSTTCSRLGNASQSSSDGGIVPVNSLAASDSHCKFAIWDQSTLVMGPDRWLVVSSIECTLCWHGSWMTARRQQGRVKRPESVSR